MTISASIVHKGLGSGACKKKAPLLRCFLIHGILEFRNCCAFLWATPRGMVSLIVRSGLIVMRKYLARLDTARMTGPSPGISHVVGAGFGQPNSCFPLVFHSISTVPNYPAHDSNNSPEPCKRHSGPPCRRICDAFEKGFPKMGTISYH